LLTLNSTLRIDPEGRCAALLVYGRQLVVIPFQRRDSVFEEHFSDVGDIKVRWRRDWNRNRMWMVDGIS
jgi:hypothetical protein